MESSATDSLKTDEYWMSLALREAAKAVSRGEVPVGAVLVRDNQLLARGSNCPISSNDPTAHAEIVALRKAAKKIDNYRLTNTTLYVTLEPCLMCAGAIVHARVKRVVYGASDPKTGALHSLYAIGSDARLNHQLRITGGVEAQKCSLLLKQFFAAKRKNRV